MEVPLDESLRTQAVIRPEDDNQLKKAVEVLNNGQ